MTWRPFPHEWPIMMGIYWSPVDSHHSGPFVRDFDGTRHLTNSGFAGDFRRQDADLTPLSYLRYSFCCQVLGCEDISIVLGSEKLHPDALPSSIRGINIVLNRDEDLSSCDENYEPCISLRWSVTQSCQDYQTYWLHWTTPELTNVTLGYGKIEALVLDLYVALWKRYDKTILDSAGTITFTNTLGPDSISRWHLTSIGNPIVEIRRSYDRLISTMGFPILARWHLYIESGPWWQQRHWSTVALIMACCLTVPNHYQNQLCLEFIGIHTSAISQK